MDSPEEAAFVVAFAKYLCRFFFNVSWTTGVLGAGGRRLIVSCIGRLYVVTIHDHRTVVDQILNVIVELIGSCRTVITVVSLPSESFCTIKYSDPGFPDPQVRHLHHRHPESLP